MSHHHFDGLVETHHDEIYKYLVLVTGRVSDASDLSQRTFLRAFEARRSQEHGTGIRPWLFAIATDLCRKQARVRSQRPQPRSPMREEDGAASAGDARHPLALALTCLPVKQRMAFALRKLHDFDYEGIGQLLQCPSQSAQAAVMQACRKVSHMDSMRSALDPVITTQSTVKE